MFDSLSSRLDGIIKKLGKRGILSQGDIDESLKEIRVALLEADVNIAVARDFVERLRSQLTSETVSKSLSPSQQIIKAVNSELTNILGGESLKITYASMPPTVVLLAGLQGAGKTTAAAKLAAWFKQAGRQVLLVAADLKRPAAVEQLRVLGSQISISVFSEPTDPVSVAVHGVAEAKRTGKDLVIVDTAGRLAVDEELMDEMKMLEETLNPHYTFFVVDAMIGQDAVATAKSFHDALDLSGIILSKLDGDARGGAALSIKQVVGKPIAFASTGEKIADFELFHPDRMASRILGMGDVLTLIEKAEQNFDRETAQKAAEQMSKGKLNLEDFLEQMRQVKKMGPLSGILSMIPGVPQEVKNANIDDKDIARIEAIICSMTRNERIEPSTIDGSRRLRIANGAGVSTSEVNLLLNQFKEAQKMISQMGFSSMVTKRLKKATKKGAGGGRITPKGTQSVKKGR